MSALEKAYSAYWTARENLLKALGEHGRGDSLPLMIYDISNLLPPDAPKPVATIASVVLAAYPGVNAPQLLGRGRRVRQVEARQVLYYLLRHYTSMSFEEIGRSLDREHGTIMWGVKQVRGLELTSTTFASRLQGIRTACARAVAA